MDKIEIIRHLETVIDEKIKHLQIRFDDLTQDLSSEHKSSAGDKHETSRSMIQLEQEKLSNQLSQFTIQKEIISKINDDKHERVQLGSIVNTTRGMFFISIGLGKLMIEKNPIFCISASSPIGQHLLNLKKNETFAFNNLTYQILEVR